MSLLRGRQRSDTAGVAPGRGSARCDGGGGLANLGASAGLVTAALLDHPEATEILEGALRLGVELNISSLRADAITAEVAGLLCACGVRTVTVAPETGAEFLRKAIGKPMSDAALLSAVRTMADGGLRALKLYFMVGLPGERDEDIEAIPELARAVRS